MRVDVLGAVAVSNAGSSVAGQSLGGRRARVALVALALAGGHVPGETLAATIWGEDLPPTWPVALRGLVRGLRSACTPIGGSDQHLIATAPSGYRLAAGVDVDIDDATADLRRAELLLGEGRHQAVVDLVEPITRFSGDQLLPGEDAGWLLPHRRAVDAMSLAAVELLVRSAGSLGRHHSAIEAAHRAVAAHPLDESTHRMLIAALDLSGDRAGAVRAYERCRTLLAEQLGVDPSAETVEVYLAALQDERVTTAARVPVENSSFIGREAEMRALDQALSQPGLVTVTGPGGVGKSRLAIRGASSRGPFGTRRWVSLAAVGDNSLVSSSVALELGVAVDSVDPAVTIAGALAPLGRVVLVLDGCEGVLDGAASLVAAVLARAPMLTVLVTSRVALSIDGERVVPVQPLPQPAVELVDSGELLGNGQVRLLLDRVREAGGELVIDGAAGPAVVALCRRCGGLPLALELVAAQLTAIPPGDLLDQLSEIEVGDDGTVRSIARSTYELLEPDEAVVFRRLAVLDGPAGLPLVRQVVSGGPITSVRVVRILRELAARGLVSVDRSGPRWRYQQDDDLHHFARDMLAEHGEEWQVHGRLADAVRSRLPDDARAAPGPFQAEITDIFGSIRSLFSAALSGCADVDRCLELAFRLHRYFATTNVNEGRFWLSRLIAASPASAWTSYATYASGYLSYWSGHIDDAMRDLGSAVELLDGLQDGYRARALIFLAGLLDDVDRGPEAVEHVRQSIEAAAPFDADLQVSAAMGMGSVLAERGDPAAAGYAHNAIELCRRTGSTGQLAIAIPTAAMICWQVGALPEARAYIAEALPLQANTKRISRVVLLSAAAGVRLADGDLDAAIEFGETADREATELGVEREMPLIRSVLARAFLDRGDIAAAARSSIGALDAALTMAVGFPAAVGLETAALVLHAAGLLDPAAVGNILATAGTIRVRGDRPPPATLASAVHRLRATLGTAPGPLATNDIRSATSTALELLAGLTAVRGSA